MTKRNSDPDPICDHHQSVYRVSSLPDTEKWTPEKGLRSAWVCGDRACVLDAQAWIARGGFSKSYVYDTNQKEVHL